MKIFKFLTGRTGKMILSATQAIAASAAVGVGGIAAWQILGSGSGDDNAFNSLGYQPQEEVVYVSGAATGKYGREDQTLSSFRAAPSKAIEMQQREAEYLRQQELARQEAERAAYKGATSPSVRGVSAGGLNEGLGNKKLEGMTPEQIKAMQQQAIEQAKGAAAAGKARADALAAGAGNAINGAASRAMAGKGGLNGTMAGAGLGGSGSAQYVGMPGSVDSGKNGGVSAVDVEDTRVRGDGREGANIPSARNLLSKPNFGVDVNARKNSKDFNSLELMAKRSAEIAQNDTRSANEAGRAFLASSKNSGGIRLESVGEVSVGNSASSEDFGDVSNSLSGLNTKMDEILDSEELFKEKRKELRRMLRQLIGATIGVCFVVPWLSWGLVKRKFNKYFSKAAAFDAEYGDRSKEARAGKKIANKLKFCAKLGLCGGIAAFATLIPWMLVDAFGWTTSLKKLKAEDDSAEQGTVGTVDGGAPSSEPGSTLNIQEGKSAADVSTQQMQEHLAESEEGK